MKEEHGMDIFVTVKAAVTVSQAAEQHEAERTVFLLLRLRSHRRCDRPCGEVI